MDLAVDRRFCDTAISLNDPPAFNVVRRLCPLKSESLHWPVLEDDSPNLPSDRITRVNSAVVQTAFWRDGDHDVRWSYFAKRA